LDGKVALPYKQFLGYRKGTDGLPEIVPENAKIVKDIYRMFLAGKAPSYGAVGQDGGYLGSRLRVNRL